MPDWDTRLAVSYTDADGNTNVISPIDAFAPTFGLGASELRLDQAAHIGVVYAPRAISFTMTQAMGTACAQLMEIALKGQRFDVTLQEGEGTDWAFKSIVLSNCVITSANTNAPVSGAPTAVFSGIELARQGSFESGYVGRDSGLAVSEGDDIAPGLSRQPASRDWHRPCPRRRIGAARSRQRSGCNGSHS